MVAAQTLHDVLDGAVRGEIRGARRCPSAPRGDLLRHAGQALGTAADQTHEGPVRGEAQRDRASDAAARAGDHRDVVLQVTRSFRIFRTRAGTPPAMAPGGTSRVTT